MKRAECTVCGVEIARGKPMCYACERAYQAATADAVAFLRAWCLQAPVVLASRIERGEAVGAAGKR